MIQVKLFFIVAIVLLSALTSGAQKFSAGLSAGIVASQVDGDHLSGFNKVGIKAGGFVNRKITENFYLRMEIDFIQKGSRMPLSKDGIFYLMRLNYIEVPVTVGYHLGKKWSLDAGGSFATLVSTLEEDQVGEITNAPPFNRNDYLVCAGITYQLTDHLFFNALYSYSVSAIRPKNEAYDYFYSSVGQYNKVIAFSLSYQF